jgi:hypothetical protein
MYITKESINRFNAMFVLSQNDIKQLTDETFIQGEFVIMYDVKSYLIMLPKVLSQIIEDYCEHIIINYTFRYPLIYGTNVIQIILSISSDEFKFNHDIECGSYDLKNNLTYTYTDINTKIRCPNIYNKRLSHYKARQFLKEYVHSSYSFSYNDNIQSNSQLQESQFDFGLLLDHIANTKKSFWKRWFSKSTFVDTKTDVLIYNKSDNIMCIKFPSGEVIEINIINQYNLDMCIQINKMIFDLLRSVQLYFH